MSLTHSQDIRARAAMAAAAYAGSIDGGIEDILFTATVLEAYISSGVEAAQKLSLGPGHVTPAHEEPPPTEEDEAALVPVLGAVFPILSVSRRAKQIAESTFNPAFTRRSDIEDVIAVAKAEDESLMNQPLTYGTWRGSLRDFMSARWKDFPQGTGHQDAVLSPERSATVRSDLGL